MKNLPKFLLILPTIFILFLILDLLFPLNLDALNKEKSQILYDRNGKIVNMAISKDQIWHFNSTKIPDIIKNSTICFEDRYFYYHFGVNPIAIIRAFAHNLTSKRKIGASTISMQVARMLKPKNRTYFNKFIEIFNAFQLELHFSKDEILQMYLNLAPYGGNIQGIKAAAYFYFAKEIDELSYAQAVLLSTIPKNPNKNRLDKKSNINNLKNRLITTLYKQNFITKSQYKRALNERFQNQRFSSIKFAPHYANIAFANKITNSNLDLDLQTNLQRFLANEIANLNDKNVKNGSAVLIDNEKMAVVAYAGSHDFGAIDGQNDGIKSIKNVGSTLKPFIYAKALDNGIITPNSKLIDTKFILPNYTPKNYSDEFMGIISATQALQFSLNIPAVRLNTLLNQDSLYEMLKFADLIEFDKEYYGAGIALGGISLSLLDLTHLYTIFANNGELKPLEIGGKIIDKNATLISPQSAYLVANMLKNTPRSYLNSVWKNTANKPNLMFKTGTSADARDLYTIALSPKWTLGVWLGNFDGSKTDDISGGESAAKVAFNMFDYLDKRFGFVDFITPTGITKQKICTDVYNNGICKDEQDDFLIEKVNLKSKCDLFDSSELYFMIKSKYLSRNDLENGVCANKFKQIRPILNDIDGKVFQNNNNFKLEITCTAVFGDEIYISIDEQKYTKKPNAKAFFERFVSGEHTIKCLDEYSNLSEAKFELKD